MIECKASVNKHQSRSRDRYGDYAVDGALLYAAHLSKDFDVLAIGVSGTDKRRMNVSHFLHLRGEYRASEIFGDELLSPAEYVEGYMSTPGKYRQDYRSLQVFIRRLNARLHINRVSEKDRSLLISAVLIALGRRSFKNAYLSEHNSEKLAQMVVDSVMAELEDADVDQPKLTVLRQKFGFLSMATALISKPNELQSVIHDIDIEVNSFIKNHQYRDVLGSLYIEFLRYANSDKGLGIVLTPPHITELFSELAKVNANSIVYDNCAGTGGFLISAMKRMVEDAAGSSAVERKIKSEQIFGVELQSDIYPLAVSNMYIHQDGKSNIVHGNCFDLGIVEKISNRRPTVGFLNPPYKADKKNDIEELEFVLNNLECLYQGGMCVALVPMQCALATSKKITNLKRKIMQKHTLEAVCSMPDELFFNSKVGVVSCVMIFTAHRQHPKNKEVFLGYFKDDGFTKHKNGGRDDHDGKWVVIKTKWLDLYENRRTVPGLSVTTRLLANDEWVAEAYMETDYSVIGDRMFEDTLHSYTTYMFGNYLAPSVTHNRAIKRKAPITTHGWKWFKLTDLFEIRGSRTTSMRELQYSGSGKYPYVTTQATNNGVEGFYGLYTEQGGVLTVDSAVLGYCSYQHTAFSASDHVEKLVPKFSMNAFVAMFLVTIINMEQYRYNYGRKCSQKRLKHSLIKLPANKENAPDFDYMKQYICRQPYSANLLPLTKH